MSALNGHAVRVPPPREVDCYDAVIYTAKLMGWHVHHQRSTRTGTAIQGHAGFPDMVFALPGLPGRRPGHVRFVEFKSDAPSAKLTPEQRAWGETLISAGAVWEVVRLPSEQAAFCQLLIDLARA